MNRRGARSHGAVQGGDHTAISLQAIDEVTLLNGTQRSVAGHVEGSRWWLVVVVLVMVVVVV